MASFMEMHQHGVGNPVVMDVNSVFADSGVETTHRFTKTCFWYRIPSAGRYAICGAAGIICGRLSVSYYGMWLFIGFGDFYFTARVPDDLLGNVTWRSCGKLEVCDLILLVCFSLLSEA